MAEPHTSTLVPLTCKVLSSEQIHQWDAFTIEHEPVSSIALMERAVSKVMEWLEANDYLEHARQPAVQGQRSTVSSHNFVVYCGKGNNGGDGLALARMLAEKNCPVKVFILEFGHKGTDDFQTNLARLHQTNVEIGFVQSVEQLHPVPADAVIIDALFGSGLNRPVDAITGSLIQHLNESGNEILSIDIPSGMFADKTSKGDIKIMASHTLSFQTYKLAFLLPENEAYFGEIHILDIGLSPSFLEGIQPDMELLGNPFIHDIYKPRKSFAHKGTYGHALLVTGSYGKMGAAVLSAKACLRTGVGLLGVMIPACGYGILQGSVPEAMVITGAGQQLISPLDEDLCKYNAIGIGPGIGTKSDTVEMIYQLLSSYKSPLVIDADALNILSSHNDLLEQLTPFSILTPHPKEFERLFGKCENDFERIELARKKAKELQVVIILKGHRSVVAMPGGKAYFNTTGNAGMATGGSGDVLTGILTSLLAQGYTPEQAAVLGVYLHGLAGDFAAAQKTQESMIASDIVEYLGDAFKEIGNL